MTEEECRIVRRIEKIAGTYDDICRMARNLVDGMSQNDWYFIEHSFQMREDVGMGKKLDEKYVNEMSTDTAAYYEEMQRIRDLLLRSLTILTVRDITFVDDENDSKGGALPH